MKSTPSFPSKHLTKRRIILAALFVCAVTIGPSLLKWFVYERENAAPKLRSMIGTEVQVPEQTFHVMGKDVVMGPHTGTLTYVGYRWNDDWGWFDLEIHLEGESNSVNTGLSPSEARRVNAAAN